MASAVLASRNEPHWSEQKLYMSDFNSNSTINPPHLYGRFNPNPNPSSCISDPGLKPRSNFSVINGGSIKPHRRQISELDAHIGRNDSFRREYVTFNLGSYSKSEIKVLKQRFISDLDRVRGVMRLEAIDMEPRASASFHGLQRRGEAPEPPPRLRVDQPSMDIRVENQAPNAASHHYEKTNNKLSGRKRAFPLATGGDHKQQLGNLDLAVVGMMRKCTQILSKVMKHKFAWVFNTPVDTKGLGLHDYHLIIKRPMDLGTVKSRLDKYEYRSPLEFADDVRLTFRNAMVYNPKGQDVHAMAEVLLKKFDEMFTSAFQKHEAELKKAVASRKSICTQPEGVVAPKSPEPMLIARNFDKESTLSSLSNPLQVSSRPVSVPAEKPSLQPVVPSRSGRLPKPKAKDPNKRQMTFQEMAKLGFELQNLPQNKMDQMMQILRKRNYSVLAKDGEIELDIEIIDNETLWELDRFVTYHKQALSKMQRQALIADASQEKPIADASQENLIDDAFGGNNNNLQGSEPIPNPVVTEKKDEAAEEDVDIGEDSPIHNFPPLRIEKDVSESRTSSSSSSSSDSSSSGSDSGNSCGNDDSDNDSVRIPTDDDPDEDSEM